MTSNWMLFSLPILYIIYHIANITRANFRSSFFMIIFKAILRDVMGEEKFYFSLFFIIHLCNDPCCHRIISPSGFSVFVLGALRNMEYMSSHSIPQCKLYRGPGKGKVFTDCVITTTPITFIFTRYCLFSMVYRFMETVENLLSKMYIEGALMSKSRNIALKGRGVHMEL